MNLPMINEEMEERLRDEHLSASRKVLFRILRFAFCEMKNNSYIWTN